jgi:spore coat protein H
MHPFKVESFKKLYIAHLSEFSETIFKPKRFHKQVEELAAALRPAVRDESEFKLERFNKVVAGESVEPVRFGGGGPGGPANDGPQRRGGDQGGGPVAGGGGPGGGGMRMGGFGQSVKPIKGFVDARAQSVADQLAGKSEGMALNDGRGGPGGPGGPGAGLAQAFASVFMNAFDANHDGQLTRDEFVAGFDRWFTNWNFDKTGQLTEAQLKAGIAQDLIPSGRAFGRGNAAFGGGRGNPGFPPRGLNGPAPGDGPPTAR